MKLALFGGSFNPIHNGHLEIANELIKQKLVHEVWFIPCGNHAFDKKLISGEKRLKMISLAIDNNSSLKVIDVELNKSIKSYSANTIKWFKENFSHEFYYILGADNIIDLNKWYNYDYLKKNVEFILIKRPEYNLNKKIKIEIKIKNILDLNNSTSSTQIRENIKNKKSISQYVPKYVDEYILKEELYND